MSRDTSSALPTLGVTRPAIVVRVRPFAIRHGVAIEAAALARELAAHAGVVVPIDDLRHCLGSLTP